MAETLVQALLSWHGRYVCEAMACIAARDTHNHILSVGRAQGIERALRLIGIEHSPISPDDR